MEKLNGLKVAVLVANGFEQSEMEKPRKALDEAGAETTLISPEKTKVKAWQHKDWGAEFDVDLNLNDADADDYQALLLPGGVINPDQLRITPGAIDFIKKMVEANKPIAAICHGPWTLIDAGAAKGKTMTSWPSLRADLTNAGATWVDKEVVSDQNIVTSRKPDDIPAFNTAMIELFAQQKS